MAQWESELESSPWPEYIAPAPADLCALGQLAGIDFLSDSLHQSVLEQAHQHKASALVRFEHELEDEEFDEDDEGDYDVEVVEEA